MSVVTIPFTQRTFAGMYDMVEKSFGEFSGPFVCTVQSIDDEYNHESDMQDEMTFKLTGQKTEASLKLIRDILWGTHRSNDEPLGTYAFNCVWNENRGQCYIAVSESSEMTERMMHVWHFPYIEGSAVYGDNIVFVRS